MRKKWRKIFGTAALALMLCLTGLVMSGEAQAQRFVDNGDGTVTDTATNLMWTKDVKALGELTWNDAKAGCASFSISGIGGRLRHGSTPQDLVLSQCTITRGSAQYVWSSVKATVRDSVRCFRTLLVVV